MLPLKMILITLIFIGAASAVPDDVLCCSPGSGTFLKESNVCWDEKRNKTANLTLACDLYISLTDMDVNFTVNHFGQVHFYTGQGAAIPVTSGTYCLANETEAQQNGSIEVLKVITLCQREEENNNALSYCMIVSSVFYFITTVVYVALPEIRDLQGKSIINFCGSLAIGLMILGVMRITEYSDMNLCAVRGFLVYFFIMASSFWMNAISVQILFSMRRPIVNNYGWKEFLWYALYAWGCPVILTVCMAIVNFHPGDHYKPGIGLNNCWFFNIAQQWYYLYSVMSILILVNICIFIYISINIWQHTQFSSTHVKALRYKFLMSLRMFIIMGLPWIFEMIGSLTEKTIVWFILDFFNMLQGPLIFLILVVLRKRVIKALFKRGLLDCIAGPLEKYLAVKDDDEAGVMQHTVDVTMDERNGI